MSNLHSIEGESSPCTPDSSKFTVLYYNARSLIPKMDELRTIVESQRPSVICVVETWLSEEVSDQEISLSEYHVNVSTKIGTGVELLFMCTMQSL